MRVSSQAPRQARDPNSAWRPWAATSSYSEGVTTEPGIGMITRTTSIGSRRRRCSGSSSMGLSSRAFRPARDPDTPWWPWAASCTSSEGTRIQVRRHAALAGHRLGAYQILHRHVLRAITPAVRTRPDSLGRGWWAWRHQGLVTRGEAQPLYAGRMSRSGHTDGHVHNVASRATQCAQGLRVEDGVAM